VRISAGASPGIASESPYIQVDLTANPNADAKAIFMTWYQQRGSITEMNSDPQVRWGDSRRKRGNLGEDKTIRCASGRG
jgi:hypothetical protein